MRTVTDYDIQALLDNELTDDEEQDLTRIIHGNPTLMKRYMELRRQKKMLQLWWASQENKRH